MDNHLEKFLEKYPFFAVVKYGEKEYVCIVQNCDPDVTTIYDWDALRTEDHRKLFLDLAEQWWWESNRLVPINIFLKQDWNVFQYVSKTLVTKELSIVAGHAVKLQDLAIKRTKRKMVQLIRRPAH